MIGGVDTVGIIVLVSANEMGTVRVVQGYGIKCMNF